MSLKIILVNALSLFSLLMVIQGCAATVDLNKVQPPPRTDLEKPLDLYESRYVINDQTLNKMRSQGLNASITDALNDRLSGQTYSNSRAFREAVEEVVPNISEQDLQIVMMSALETVLVDNPSEPAGTISLNEAQQRQQSVRKVRIQQTSEVKKAQSLGFERLLFDFDRYDIKAEYVSVIQDNARLLIDNPNLIITIEGHCDERGSNQYNLALGERRAAAVKRAMIAEGVPANQIQTVSYGEERPAVLGSDELAWSENRRAVFAANE